MEGFEAGLIGVLVKGTEEERRRRSELRELDFLVVCVLVCKMPVDNGSNT